MGKDFEKKLKPWMDAAQVDEIVNRHYQKFDQAMDLEITIESKDEASMNTAYEMAEIFFKQYHLEVYCEPGDTGFSTWYKVIDFDETPIGFVKDLMGFLGKVQLIQRWCRITTNKIVKGER